MKGAPQRGPRAPVRHWPRWLGGVTVVVLVYGPWTLAVFGGFVDQPRDRPLVIGLVCLGLTAYVVTRLTGRALGLDRSRFRDYFPIQGPVSIWAVGARLIDVANGSGDDFERESPHTKAGT